MIPNRSESELVTKPANVQRLEWWKSSRSFRAESSAARGARTKRPALCRASAALTDDGAIDYAWGRFGGSRGEIHVYGDDASTIERNIIIDGRGQYPQGACD